jgi:3alpha(or 20beta)-hydroxysteroid dehydrogenase
MLEDKIAIVTGAAGGIGLATACEFARRGATLMLVDVDARRLALAADAVRAAGGGTVATTPADVSSARDVRRYVDATVAAFGRIEVLFNNAGVGGAVAPIAEYDPVEFDRVIAIDLRSVFLGLRYVLPVMLEQGSGAIISTASIAGEVGLPGTCAYNASKHGLIGLTKTAAAEVGRLGIRVNAVCPGAVDTGLLRDFSVKFNPDDPEAAWAQLAERQPNGRLGTPEEIAAVVAFLASDEASYVSGVAWPVDGGALGTMVNPS